MRISRATCLALAIGLGLTSEALSRSHKPWEPEGGVALLTRCLQGEPVHSDSAGTAPRDLESWASTQLPFVAPDCLLTCARQARSEGRHEDAMRWVEEALSLSPAQSAEFLACLQDLRQEQGRGHLRSGSRAHRHIGDLVQGRDWLLDGHKRRGLEWPLSLVHSARRQGLPGRLALAAWQDDPSRPLPPGGSLLDQAAARYHRALLLQWDQPEEALALLQQACDLVPPSSLAGRVHGLRWVLLVQTDAPLGALIQALDPDLVGRTCFLPYLDRGLEHLVDQDDTARLRPCLDHLETAFDGQPYQARLHQLRSRTTTDPAQRRVLLESALAETRPMPEGLPLPQVLALQELSRMNEQEGRLAEAVDQAARALVRTEPRDPHPLARVLDLLVRQGREQEARRLYAAAVRSMEDLAPVAQECVRAILDRPFASGAASDKQ